MDGGRQSATVVGSGSGKITSEVKTKTATATATATESATPDTPRDKFAEAGSDIMLHITDKVVALTRKQEFIDRLQTAVDPFINHIINRVFPYILLTSILFLILLLVSVTTFVIVVKGWLTAIRGVDRTMTTGLPDEWFPVGPAAAATAAAPS